MGTENANVNVAVQRIIEDLGGLQAFSESLNISVEDVNEATFEQASTMLRQLRSTIRLLQDSEQGIEQWLADVWAHKQQEARENGEKLQEIVVPHVGTVEVKRGNERKSWDHEGLGKAVLESLLSDTGGEVPTPWQVRDAIMAAAGIGYWRVNELRRLGINVDDYCTKERGKRSVVIR